MSEEPNALLKIRNIADYQFGQGIGKRLFPDEITIKFSKRTGRIRHVHFENKRLATLRPTDGLFAIAIEGAKRIMKHTKSQRLTVGVTEKAVPFVGTSKSVFAKHVLDADEEIRPQEEVIILNRRSQILAVGRAILSGTEMKTFTKGVAVRVRIGVAEKLRKTC